MPAVVGVDFTLIIVASIALERLLCTSHPMFHKRIEPKIYVGIACLCALIYAASFRILAYFTVVDFPVMCIAPFATFGVTVDVWFSSNFCINAGIVLSYVHIRRNVKTSVAGIVIHQNPFLAGTVVENAEYRKINKSLQTHVCVYLLGWASVSIMSILIVFIIAE
ncbi:hypothetical protein L596_026566 [Steinernema carpocapsae]|uniref:G-protein coupled receptors family 1 profile domain-containing protein n=1 Tax=Steinernema carpocapsae TaxID=34508 RepID=A0A4U5M1T9_STECR|nr:hypothetical protein L596_026566 [Steinernema carpocapsae]